MLAPAGLGVLAVGGRAWRCVVLAGMAGVGFEWTGMTGRPVPARAAALAATVVAGAAGAGERPLLALGIAFAGAAACAGAGEPALGFGVPYVALPGLALMRLRRGAGGFRTLLLLLFATWASDTGAYAAGRALGGPRLAPAISPAKTWAGAGGGLLAASLVGALFGRPRRAAALALAAQGGDLLESLCKRRFGVKDSGRLIPGHGGLLDRLDGLMTAAMLLALLRATPEAER